MSSFVLKILACFFMLIDHIGAIIFPDIIFLRAVGRLAFPIFAYLVAEGYRKTSDITNYLGRLIMFAILSQLPYLFAFNLERALNVFFTLTLALYAIYSYEKKKKTLIIIIASAACQLVPTDWGAIGILWVFIFHKYHDEYNKIIYYSIILIMLFLGFNIFDYVVSSNHGLHKLLWVLIQPISLTSLLLIKFYNGNRGPNVKYLFYIFYPLHLIILGLIEFLM